MATRVGVDIGGTFTDLIFYDDLSGEVTIAKEPTTPAAPEEGVVRAVERAIPPELRSSTRYFLHGTTSGLNALLERKGAVVGMLTTRGFRDVLEIRRGDREGYTLFWSPPPPLVPRRLRLPVSERIMADGSVHAPLEEDDVREAVERFDEEGVDCVAIAFINAYANPEHELRAAEALRRFGFEGEISLSHQVSGEYREYERTSTTVIDAYVRPRMMVYLRRLDEKLAAIGVKCDRLVTRSGGGSMTFAEAEQRPFETIQSGPVAGAECAGELARNLGLGDVITADVGGTSFDTSLIVDGRPTVLFEGQVIGLPIQTPWVDVRSIGAGGGSIAHVDVGGLLRVGPQSAGADPGPACYCRGGTQPTVTDAAAILGMLADGALAGGVQIDRELAEKALEPLADKLGMGVEKVAQGVLRIAAANMANAVREITIERGQDPRRAKLMAFGGAGPLFATLLASELEIVETVVPPYAGNYSAWGLLGSDLTRVRSQTKIMTLSDGAIAEASTIAADLFADLETGGTSNGAAVESLREVALDMRYAGQEHTLTVAVASAEGAISVDTEGLRDQFRQEHQRTFGLTMEESVEIVNVRATVRVPLPRRSEDSQRPDHDGQGESADLQGPDEVVAFSFTQGERLPFKVMDRARLAPGDSFMGPAIVLEDTTTTYVDSGFAVRVDSSKCLFISKEEVQ